MMIVFLNGKFVREEDAKISVFDHGFLYGDGVYETLRTYGGKVWQLKEHLQRLRRSAQLLGIRIPWADAKIDEWVQKTVRLNFSKLNFEVRIRITVTRGVNNYNFVSCKNPTLCIQAQKLVPEPSKIYNQGVSIVIFPDQRNLPEAKTISLLSMILGKRFAVRKRAYEAIFVDREDSVLEGTVSNIFMVCDGVVITPKNNILGGTTRVTVLKCARKLGFKIREADFKVKELYQAEEIFITNAPKGIVPVVKVDGRKVAKGKPGAITKMLIQSFYAGLEH